MLSIQKFNKFRQRSLSPKFRLSHQPPTYSHSKTHSQMLSSFEYKAKHPHYHSGLTFAKFRYLHKFDQQKLEKKYDIMQKLLRFTPKQALAQAQNHENHYRVRISSGLRFQFMPFQDFKSRAKEEMIYVQSKSFSSKCKLSLKQKLEYRLNEHKKFVAEFGGAQPWKMRLQNFKKSKEHLSKKPMKRIITFHKPQQYFD